MRALRVRVPSARAVVLTSYLDDERLLPAIRAGAAGYLLKSVQPQELATAVRTAAAGQALIDPVVAARLVEALDGGRDDGVDRLTPREREVLALLARGFANKRIATELGIAEKTVKTHVSNVLAKLGVSDRTQAALYASRLGLGS
jgi:DNA-binding NarL/FixJ family response regulator